ncbi:helix-turn-helix transcriptional regulator [Actinomyces faecalis]|uniref:helix-turn-helix transcriptional regulator n=1 Tax=Actinomyces faecalis TaxID=2722820 RepID=UPI002E284ABC|nr:helix-turn-helix domain-containing protein [Actinomyces faecalis]
MPVRQPPRLPHPSWDDLSARAELSTAHLRVLETVETAHRPLRAAEVAQRLGLHHNTVREHLDSLVSAGFVSATAQPTGRRGRPALAYAAVAPDPGEVLDSYLALLDAVAQTLGEGEEAERLAVEIGRRWAHETTLEDGAVSEGPSDTTRAQDDLPLPAPDQAVQTLLPGLTRMGFAPELVEDKVVLRACPLVTGSRVPHDLVCLMHEGFLNEALPACEDDDAHQPGGRRRLTVTPLLPDGCHLSWRG